MSRRPVARGLLLAVAGATLFALGWGGHAWWSRRTEPRAERRVHLGGYRLISPLLDVELPEGNLPDNEPIPFEAKVASFVDEAVRSGKVREMSVYYRDLLDGPWFGINEDRRYNPASMMKVPVMIAWLKRAERDPGVLRQTFEFDERTYPGSDQVLSRERTLLPHGRYTVDELLRHMLSYSDNRAMWLLFNGLRTEELNAVVASMDVSNERSGPDNSISVRGYSGFFRVLFNATFLDKAMSEKALELLALQDFPRGIEAGVPRGVPVAAKFGETSPGPGGVLQLHEFGIVYHPRGPYILGIMTVGQDWGAQADILRDVSALVYREVEAEPTRTAAR